MLVGIYLSDTFSEDSGNFTVFPGTHIKHAEYFKQHGPDSILNEKGKMKMPPIELGQPVQIQTRLGDVVIADYLLAHTVACNASPYIRYALYFRITSNQMAKHRTESLTSPSYDIIGLKNL